jgi:hypothetical protein
MWLRRLYRLNPDRHANRYAGSSTPAILVAWYEPGTGTDSGRGY